jgi:hypothetical protein
VTVLKSEVARPAQASQPVANITRKPIKVGPVCQGLSANTPTLEALSTTCSMPSEGSFVLILWAKHAAQARR